MKNTVCCLLQNRLGALDRVLGALTHRGFLPNDMVSRMDQQANRMKVWFSFECDDEKAVEKLLKFLQKQVYVLEAQKVAPELQMITQPVAAMNRLAQSRSFVSPSFRVKRRVNHVD